jgi:hypothetical protein
LEYFKTTENQLIECVELVRAEIEHPPLAPHELAVYTPENLFLVT